MIFLPLNRFPWLIERSAQFIRKYGITSVFLARFTAVVREDHISSRPNIDQRLRVSVHWFAGVLQSLCSPS
jgi:hypothetical protein